MTEENRDLTLEENVAKAAKLLKRLQKLQKKTKRLVPILSKIKRHNESRKSPI
jgi:hypothetical protein